MVPQQDVKLARYEFFQCQQEAITPGGEPESMTQFINRARELVKSCNFGNLGDEMLRDKIIMGIRDVSLKKRFIEQQDLTSAMVIQRCQTEEATRAEMERNNLFGQATSSHAVNKLARKPKKCAFCDKEYHKKLSDCPARGTVSKEEVPESSDESDVESVTTVQYLYSLKQDDEQLLTASLTFFSANKQPVPAKCILDTGATCNVIGINNAKRILNAKQLKMDKQQATMKVFGGGTLKSLGRVIIKCVHNENNYNTVFHVVDFEQQPLLSRNKCLQLKLIQLCLTITSDHTSAVQQVIEKYPAVFNGLGNLEGSVHLEVDKSVKPVVQQPRRIAVTLRDELRRTITEMGREGIIVEEKHNTDWVSNLVLVKRNNKIRMPTVDELLPELSNAKVFTTVDAKCGFWQISLDEESSRLTTFWTPFGRYRWLRMPFGISPAPEIF
ncbi:uncharacterized protein K02A2.6-like [Aedes albopictus]|uniref:Reverse transcriptase domain-containing protein n=1 Tax=Aedes albopictus TaxID=7160 RepID=A0ABM1YQ12_AEDAL